ncbi:tRNA N6-adenosine(37)-N6-threonylcarbamoyltransferase complex dimerization subunit TsaB [Croceicoccus estronivorus]|uniref:tRNA (adenosine(37)-N6)-threonylcarbamoyltransferase complex dimerization subunit type 1 TsaB n=1 Tax=Croceicoccus estronivorus TaxID=1172626 RepID=UPI00083219A8|nr:tRNA (adenosine(37)-N6)-threonylcarbamoyltransferase complex dimerization subunit type 1 TsaB [Croceicoccus estronivorus]OCC22753.1 tRNA N6-adenosine(37)-N6-threonylcarbamoyltransferase complex dimerization subunit TsaB [Croceicoccus estronivorus]
MRTLAIDCATENCSAALFEGDVLVGSECAMLGRGHAEHLIPMIARLPHQGRADRIAVSLGPGSFTGVRIGLAAARALALAWGADVIGYPTLALIAAMARNEAGDQPVTVVMTGGHGEWFLQNFDAFGEPDAPLASLRPQDASNTANATLVAGSQAEALCALRKKGHALPLLPDARQFPLLAEGVLVPEPAPLYGRPPDAKIPD